MTAERYQPVVRQDKPVPKTDELRYGGRTIIVTDAPCSSADETHDAMMNVYENRLGQQVECVSTETILENWRFK